MSAPSKRQSRKMLCGAARKSGWKRLSKRTARKSHVTKRQPASENLSKRALRKSTLRSVARLMLTMRSGGVSGAGSGAAPSISSPGSLGPLSRWDTAARRELTLVRQLRGLLRIRLLAVLDEDLVDLGHERVH